MNEKVYLGNATKRQSQYGEFFTGSIKLKDLETHDNGKGYINFVMNELKQPGKYGETHSIALNTYKKGEVDTSKSKPIDSIDLGNPF